MRQHKLVYISAMALCAGGMNPLVASDQAVSTSLDILGFVSKNPGVLKHQMDQVRQEVDGALSCIEQALKNVRERQTFVDLLPKDENKEIILQKEEETRANILASLQQVLAGLRNLDKVRESLEKMKIPHLGSVWDHMDHEYIKDRIGEIDSILTGTKKVLNGYYQQNISQQGALTFIKTEAVTVTEWIEIIKRITDKKSFLEKYVEVMAGESPSEEESEG